MNLSHAALRLPTFRVGGLLSLLVLLCFSGTVNGQNRELTTNGGTISANTNSATAVRLLDNDTTTVWTSASTGVAGGNITIRIIYASPVPIVVTQYSLTVAGPYRDRDPKNWSITAADTSDFSGGVTIAGSSVTNQSFSGGATKTLSFTNTQSYKYYRLSVTAINGATTGTQLSEFHLYGPVAANPTPPAFPQNFRSTVSKDTIFLAWTDIATNETGYVIERSTDGSSYLTIDTLASNTVQFTDTGLPVYTGHYYRIRALGSASDGHSAWSPPLYVTSSGPVPLIDITANNGLVTLSNGANSGKNLFDDNTDTKSGIDAVTGWIQHYGTFPAVVRQYTLTAADNNPGRDPKNWLLLASTDGTVWDTLDSQTNETFPSRGFTRGYTLSNTNAYNIYRLAITANNGDPSNWQLAEVSFNATNVRYQFVGDFEVPDTGFWRPGGRCSTCDYAIQLRQDTVRNGQYAARFELNRNDPESYVGSWRSELALNTEPRVQVDRWYGFSIFIPADYAYDVTNEILAQWHSTPDYAIGDLAVQSPPLSLRTEAGEWVVARIWDTSRITSTATLRTENIALGSYQRGVWTDWVFHVRWDYGQNGLLEVWKNGQQVIDRQGPNTYNDSLGVFFKTGIYKAVWDPAYSSTSTSQKRVVFIDDVRVGNELATYADVAPPVLNGYTYPVQPLTPGNLVIVRTGDNFNASIADANRVFLDEYTPAGTLVSSLPLPAFPYKGNKRLTITGSTSEGLLTLSPDSTLLAVAGYDAAPGTVAPGTVAGTTIGRSVGIINQAGHISTSQSINDYHYSIRTAITNGTGIWLYGSSGGIRYISLDNTVYDTLQAATTSTQVLGSPDGKGLNIADGQLYLSQASTSRSAIVKAGAGLPTTAPQSASSLPGLPSGTGTVTQFFFARIQLSATTSDVLYYIHDGNRSGIQKYSLVNGSWTFNDSLPLPENGIGLTGMQHGDTVTLFITSQNRFYRFTDTSGYNHAIGGPDTLQTLVHNNNGRKKFKGIALAPKAAPLLLRQQMAPATSLVLASPAVKLPAYVFPSPSAQFINIHYPASNQAATLFISDMLGKKVVTQVIAPNSSLTTVNIGRLLRGVYVVSLSNSARRITTKFVKE